MENGKVGHNSVHKMSKQMKDELDRIKQAAKKKRRLEKALATSAAIRSELEKKKQRKKEEQERLDEEGAAIAEAVALHVLLGEDSNDEGYNRHWDCRGRVGHFVGPPRHLNVPIGWGNTDWSHMNHGFGPLSGRQYFENGRFNGGMSSNLSDDLMVARGVSALRIGGEEVPLDTYVFNQMLRG